AAPALVMAGPAEPDPAMDEGIAERPPRAPPRSGCDARSLSGMANPLVINAAELLRRPGNERDLELTVRADELDVAGGHVAVDADVDIRLHLESLSDGIVVTGDV